MSDRWDFLQMLADLLGAHVLLSASAIGLGIVVALPLAVWAARSARVAQAVLGFASLVQTVPALALLALFFPILLSLRAVFGEGLPTLGFLPALLALALYALLPILRNAVTAQANLDPGVIEAAHGVGMNDWQRLWLVEAPLSAPFIMAGIRTAAVWTVGAATLATTIGQKSLGDPIFAGLQTQNWELVVAGCMTSAALALVADGLLGMIEKGLARRDRRLTLGGLAAVLLCIGAAFASQVENPEKRQVIIGAKGFSEQYILARLIGQNLERAGYSVDYRDGLGSAVAHKAVSTGAIDILVDYTGTIWTNQMERKDNPGRDEMLADIIDWEEQTSGTHVLGRLGFENAYALAMRQVRAASLGIVSLEDLARVAPRLTIGGDPEFFERPEWRAVRSAYGLEFADHRNFAPTFMYNALKSGEADVISGYTSDGRIEADDLLILEDPKRAFPNYDAIVLLAPKAGSDATLVMALKPLIGTISVEAMRRANFAVDREVNKLSFDEAARLLAKESTAKARAAKSVSGKRVQGSL